MKKTIQVFDQFYKNKTGLDQFWAAFIKIKTRLILDGFYKIIPHLFCAVLINIIILQDWFFVHLKKSQVGACAGR